jgi:hypothetical protein
MHDIEDYRLGKTNKLLQLETRADNIQIANHMANQCQKSLQIISRTLDPIVFDTAEFADAVKYLALRHRRSQIQIIVFEAEAIVKRGHRLLEIAGKLSSSIELRKAHYSFNDYNECMIVADAMGYIHRQNGERYECSSNFKDRRHSAHLLRKFTDMWELATPDPNFRKMIL